MSEGAKKLWHSRMEASRRKLSMSLNKLIKTARKSNHQHYKHATLVIRGGAIVASGYNHGETHSEVMAVSKLWPNKRKGCSIINIRLTNSGFAMAAPCDACTDYLRDMGIEKVTYSDRNGEFKEIKL